MDRSRCELSADTFCSKLNNSIFLVTFSSTHGPAWASGDFNWPKMGTFVSTPKKNHRFGRFRWPKKGHIGASIYLIYLSDLCERICIAICIAICIIYDRSLRWSR